MSYQVFPAGTGIATGATPYPFVRVPGGEVEAALATLRDEHPDRTPVIWGLSNEVGGLFDGLDEPDAEPLDVVLRLASEATGAEHLARYHQATNEWVRESYKKRGWKFPEDEERPALTEAEMAEAAQLEPNNTLVSLMDYTTRQLAEEVLIGLIPTAKAWEVPAYLRYGGWNACPPPHVHTALARDWSAQFGARLVAITSDVLEFEVERPIATLEQAREMAALFDSYCADIVDQGVGSTEALAHTLRGARFWYFWWD